MIKSTGVVGVTPDGKYLYEGKAMGHVSLRTYYSVVDNLDQATLFKELPKQTEYTVTAVPAYSERLVRMGTGE